MIISSFSLPSSSDGVTHHVSSLSILSDTILDYMSFWPIGPFYLTVSSFMPPKGH